jgi:amino acid transporter
MIYSLLICTTLYAIVALILTGMVSYRKLGVGDPLAFVFGPEGVNVPWISGVVSISAVIALATVLLVFQVGQPRIWMAMSRDGLLPPIFSAIHPKYKTPWVSTLLTGAMVAIPSLFMNLTEVTDLTSIGTLFAFILVCGGTLRLHSNRAAKDRKFKTPYINSKLIFPALMLAIVAGLFIFNRAGMQQFFSLTDPVNPAIHGWEVFKHKIPFCIYAVSMMALSYLCLTREFSLIPVLGLATCGYLITELGLTNWIRFGVWLLIGFAVYFMYGVKHSRLREPEPSNGRAIPRTVIE